MIEILIFTAILSALAAWLGYTQGWRRGVAYALPLGAAKGARDVLYYQSLGVQVVLGECDCDECVQTRKIIDEIFERAKR